jgi:hypothetical protein
MDPGFLFATTHFLQYSQFIQAQNARIKAEQDEKIQQEMLAVQRRELLHYAAEEAKTLIFEASVFPGRTFVKLQVILNNLNYLGVIPDSYEDHKEKEDIILLWQKYNNLLEKCRLHMTDDQFLLSANCMNAIFIRNHTLAVAERLEKYIQYQRIKVIWDSYQQKLRNTQKRQKTIQWVCGVLTAGFFLVFTYRAHEDPLAPLYLLAFILSGIAGLTGILILSLMKPKKYAQMKALHDQLFREADIGDEVFWKTAVERYGGTPTMEQLTANLVEQDAIIFSVLGKPEQYDDSG